MREKRKDRDSMASLLFKHRSEIKSFMRVVFGGVWLIDGALKFQPGMTEIFVSMIQQAGQGQPAWLMPWFNFWMSVVGQNPVFWVYLIGIGELLLGLALVFGFVRKITYISGAALSLVIWGVPEGFGGPYGPSSTDIGTGIIYCFMFIALMLINAGYGTSKYSLDGIIEKKVKWWKRISEFKS